VVVLGFLWRSLRLRSRSVREPCYTACFSLRLETSGDVIYYSLTHSSRSDERHADMTSRIRRHWKRATNGDMATTVRPPVFGQFIGRILLGCNLVVAIFGVATTWQIRLKLEEIRRVQVNNPLKLSLVLYGNFVRFSSNCWSLEFIYKNLLFSLQRNMLSVNSRFIMGGIRTRFGI
jgi:hypothetical protein